MTWLPAVFPRTTAHAVFSIKSLASLNGVAMGPLPAAFPVQEEAALAAEAEADAAAAAAAEAAALAEVKAQSPASLFGGFFAAKPAPPPPPPKQEEVRRWQVPSSCPVLHS
jgi:hypothetical protein